MYSQYAKTRPQHSELQSNRAAPGQQHSTNRIPNASTSTASFINKPQPYRSVNTYVDRITIAGLHNYVYARGKYEKITWNITFLLAIAVTIYYLFITVKQYLEYTIVLDIQHQTDPPLRLPNPYVCHMAVNRTFLREEFEKVKPELAADKRIQLIARRYQKIFNQTTPVTVDTLIWYALNFITARPAAAEDDPYWRRGYQPQYVFEFISKAVRAGGSKWLGEKSFYEMGMFECRTVVMNCTIDESPFDCCRDGPIGYARMIDKCFGLNIRREIVEKRIQKQQQEHAKPIVLELETFMTDPSAETALWSVDAWQMSISFGNRMAGLFDYNQMLEGGSQSVITITGTKRMKLANCMGTYKYRPQLHSDTHPIIREYFDDMSGKDRYSVGACQMGKLFEALYTKCGCVPYYDNMRPQDDNVICTPAHLNTCVFGAFQNDLPTNTNGDTSSRAQEPTVEDAMKRDLFENIKQRMADECSQLCESWTYDYSIFSTNMDDLEGNTSSINRTKLTIVFDPEYRVKTEVYKTDSAAFIANLGDALGLILGFSAVTLVQLPIWSIVACLFKRRQNKISAKPKQDVAHAQSPGQKR